MKIDCRGHDTHIPHIEQRLESDIRIFKKLYTNQPELLAKLLALPFHGSSACCACGDDPSYRTEDQGESFVANTECAYKDGFPPIEAFLEVPSGEILLFNDFRQFYNKRDESIDINSTLGKRQYTEHFAIQGLIMHFVGNSSPSVLQVSDERLEIGNFSCQEEDGCTLPECPMPTCKYVNPIGNICTDLWWYCAVDREAFEKKAGKTVDQFEEEFHARGYWPDVIRAKVIPGIYRTVGQYHIDSERLYSYIERLK